MPAPGTLGLNPSDDDAGSGGDAGDTRSTALPIDEGTYTGTLLNPIDARDQYVFHAERGEVLRLDWEDPGYDIGIANVYAPDGRQYGHDMTPGEDEYVLHQNGTWRLEFEVGETSLGPVDYTFSLELHEPHTGAVAGGDDRRAATLEARFEEPTDVFTQVWSSVGLNATDAFAARARITYDGFLDADSPDPYPVQGAIGHYIQRGAAGTDVHVTNELRHEPGMHVEEDGDGIEWLSSRSWLYDFRGTVHVVSYVTSSDGGLMAGISAGSGLARSASFDDVVHWTNDDVPADTKAIAPGISAVGPWTKSIELDRSFSGVFDTSGGAAADTNGSAGSVEGPEGAEWTTHDTFYLLDRTVPGEWTFHANNTSLGTGARSFFSGAFTPDLGIWNGVVSEED